MAGLVKVPWFVKGFGAAARKAGQAMDRIGQSFQDTPGYVEKLVPSTRVVAVKGKEAKYGLQNFVASSASLVGEVSLGEMSSAWYGATVRGDLAPVTIGRGSAVLDNAVVSSVKGQPTTLGSEVTVCAGAVVQSASVGDGSMIGMGATVLPGATIGNDSFVDAGAVVAAGSKIGSGELWTGKPAQFLRKLSADEMSYLRTSATTTATLGQTHYGQGEMSVAQVEKQERLYVLRLEASMASNAPLPVPDPDVLEYYRLTTPKVNSELFRESEFDMAKLAAAKAEAELAADRAEEEYYYGQARLRRVGDAVKQLSEVRADRPAARDKVVRDLAARDPEGAQQLTALLARASAAAAGDAIAKEDVLRSIQAIDFTSTTAEEAKSAAEAAFNALSAHGKSLPPAGSQLLGAAASSASTAQAAAQ